MALAEALHYVQDRCVPSPAENNRLHRRIEDGASRLHDLLERIQVDLLKPVGRRELRKLLREQPVAKDARRAIICDALYTYAVLYAVLANPLKAPEHLLEKAAKVRRTFTGWRLVVCVVLALASVIAYTLLALALLSANVYLLGVVGCPCQLSTPR
uniref:Uncharacterized protein n=1 Tax=Thermofilum pendens TaxID=2269 RepID=A0A7C1T1W8_THEPE